MYTGRGAVCLYTIYCLDVFSVLQCGWVLYLHCYVCVQHWKVTHTTHNNMFYILYMYAIVYPYEYVRLSKHALESMPFGWKLGRHREEQVQHAAVVHTDISFFGLVLMLCFRFIGTLNLNFASQWWSSFSFSSELEWIKSARPPFQ